MGRCRLKRTKPISEAGFSLVETVAAMGILAMAAIPLMQISSDATRNTGRLEVRLLARTVAENIMAQTFADPAALDAGIRAGTSEQMGREFAWTLTIGVGVPGAVQTLDIAVQPAGDTQVLAQLSSLKAVPRPILPAPSELEREGE